MYTHTIDYKSIAQSELSAVERRIIEVMARYSKNFKCSIQQAFLASEVGCGLSTLKRLMLKLKQNSWLMVSGKNKKFSCNIYQISQKAYKPIEGREHIKPPDFSSPSLNMSPARSQYGLHNIYTYISITHAQRVREELGIFLNPKKPTTKPQEPKPAKEKITNINEVREVKRKFPMTDDFELDETFELQCKMGGIDYKTLSESFLEEAMAEFKDYWVDEVGREHTRRQWQSKFIMNIKRNPPKKERGGNLRAVKQTAFANRTGREAMSAEEFSRMNKLMSVIVPEPINFARLG